MILREMSFSGDAMTMAQIATAIDYIPARTETALERMENAGQVLRNEGRWTIGATPLTLNKRLRSRRQQQIPKTGHVASRKQPSPQASK
jgi:hypothetical protein